MNRLHNAGRGAAYTRSRRPVRLVYRESARDHGAALRREAAIKRLARARKEQMVTDRTAGEFAGFGRGALSFLRSLARNNRREWFERHRAEYELEVLAPLRELVEEMDVRLATIAPSSSAIRDDPSSGFTGMSASRQTSHPTRPTPPASSIIRTPGAGLDKTRRVPGRVSISTSPMANALWRGESGCRRGPHWTRFERRSRPITSALRRSSRRRCSGAASSGSTRRRCSSACPGDTTRATQRRGGSDTARSR